MNLSFLIVKIIFFVKLTDLRKSWFLNYLKMNGEILTKKLEEDLKKILNIKSDDNKNINNNKIHPLLIK